MPDGTPTWLKFVLRAERLVGARIEAAVHSGAYFDLATRAARTRAKATGTVEGISRRALHLANLPAGTDIRRVREQLSRMERRLVELSKELDDQAAQREREVAALQRDTTPTQRETSPTQRDTSPTARDTTPTPRDATSEHLAEPLASEPR